VEIAGIFRDYAGKCRAMGKRAVTPEAFVEPLQAFCRHTQATSGRRNG
jgi:hypothetical protein